MTVTTQEFAEGVAAHFQRAFNAKADEIFGIDQDDNVHADDPPEAEPGDVSPAEQFAGDLLVNGRPARLRELDAEYDALDARARYVVGRGEYITDRLRDSGELI